MIFGNQNRNRNIRNRSAFAALSKLRASLDRVFIRFASKTRSQTARHGTQLGDKSLVEKSLELAQLTTKRTHLLQHFRVLSIHVLKVPLDFQVNMGNDERTKKRGALGDVGDIRPQSILETKLFQTLNALLSTSSIRPQIASDFSLLPPGQF
jgi:hypothetical protein